MKDKPTKTAFKVVFYLPFYDSLYPPQVAPDAWYQQTYELYREMSRNEIGLSR